MKLYKKYKCCHTAQSCLQPRALVLWFGQFSLTKAVSRIQYHPVSYWCYKGTFSFPRNKTSGQIFNCQQMARGPVHKPPPQYNLLHRSNRILTSLHLAMVSPAVQGFQSAPTFTAREPHSLSARTSPHHLPGEICIHGTRMPMLAIMTTEKNIFSPRFKITQNPGGHDRGQNPDSRPAQSQQSTQAHKEFQTCS